MKGKAVAKKIYNVATLKKYTIIRKKLWTGHRQTFNNERDPDTLCSDQSCIDTRVEKLMKFKCSNLMIE